MILLYPIAALSMATSLLPWLYLSLFIPIKEQPKKQIKKKKVKTCKNSNNVIEFGKK